MDFWPNLQRQLQVATIWTVDWQPAAIAPVLLFFGVLVVAGMILAEKSPKPQSWTLCPTRHQRCCSKPYIVQPIDRLFLWCWLGGPLLVGNILLARNNTIFAEDRYFLFLAPLFLWAAARGAVMLSERWRPAGWLMATLALLLLLAALPRLWSPSMFREDWREAARYVIAYQTRSPGLPGAALAHVDYTRNALNWYLRQEFSGDELPTYFPFGGVLSPDEIEEVVAPPLQGIAEQGTQTLWLTQSHLDGLDDQHLVEAWLNENFPLITEQYPTGDQIERLRPAQPVRCLASPGSERSISRCAS